MLVFRAAPDASPPSNPPSLLRRSCLLSHTALWMRTNRACLLEDVVSLEYLETQSTNMTPTELATNVSKSVAANSSYLLSEDAVGRRKVIIC